MRNSWRKGKIRDLLTVRMGQSPPSETYNQIGLGLPFLQGNAEFGDLFPVDFSFCTKPFRTAPEGSILFSVRAPVGETNLADQDFAIGRGLCSLIAKSGNNNAFIYSLLTSLKSDWSKLTQGSTFESVNKKQIESFEVWYPENPNEQSAIAKILTTVDEVIAATKAKIAKLEAIKTGMLQDLLTHGIDEHGQIRSPQTHRYKKVPEYGWVPEEWEVKSISELAEVNPKMNRQAIKEDDIIGFLGMSDVKDSGGLFQVHLRKRRELITGYSIFQSGDILFAKITPCMENGKGCIVPKLEARIWFGSTEFHVLRPRNCLYTEILFRILQSKTLRKKAEAEMTGSAGQRRVQAAFFKKFKLPFPSNPKEAEEIGTRILTIESQIESNEDRLQKLHLIKSGLMQDLLTGKIRVPAHLIETA